MGNNNSPPETVPGTELSASSTHEMTHLLREWRSGDENALARLVETCYAELRKIARAETEQYAKRAADTVLLLAQAEEILRQQDLRLLAAATLRRRGELEGAAGIHQIEAADTFMRSENILRPDRMTAMILPGAWF